MAGVQLTATSLAAAADEVLGIAGYEAIEDLDGWTVSHGGVYEDPYSIVGLAVFETWAALLEGWLTLQVALAQLIAEHFAKGEPKVWEGYLVLLTPSVVASDGQTAANDIRRDTQHVRKLLGTGDELSSTADVERLLFPLLPLSPPNVGATVQDALGLLPSVLSEHGIDPLAVQAVVRAFIDQAPIVDRLHEHLHQGTP